jgi:quercetin dioxygenase-like cupin family protein
MSDYQITPFNQAPKVPFSLDGRKLFTSEHLEIIHLILQPGEGMEPHSQPMDVVFFVLEGTGTLTVANDPIEAAANTTIYVKSGVQRGWANFGSDSLRILVNKLIQ